MTTRALPDVVEYRTRTLTEAHAQLVERAEDAAPPMFTGHALVTNVRTAIGNPFGWGWYEQMATGVADRTVTEDDQRFLIDHDTALLVARVTAGDLRLSPDGTGLGTEADLDLEVSYIRDLKRNVEMKRITGMSVGFRVRSDEWTSERVDLPDGAGHVDVDVRTITDIELLEVSAVAFPAYPTTDAGLRSMREARGLSLSRPPQTDNTHAVRQLGMRHDLLARRNRP